MLLGERHAGRLQHLLGLLERQRQRRLADLGQLVAQPQPPEPQRRVGARGDHDPQGGRRAVQELVEVAVDRLGDLVEVVEHEHDGLVAPVQRRDQRRRQAVDTALRVGGERRHRLRRRRRGRAPRGRRARTAGGRRRRGRASHATGPGGPPTAIQLPSSTVLPAPGGAEINVRARCVPRRALHAAVRAPPSPAVPEAARTSSPAVRGASDAGLSRRSSSPKGMDGVTGPTLSHPAGVSAAHPAARHDRRHRTRERQTVPGAGERSSSATGSSIRSCGST